ncbi:MAG: LptF/LptG family permease [Candidatus Omnitrophota bacterium]|nr:LptF/LptG family permease [Candidatus Omnitrophota bacterium]
MKILDKYLLKHFIAPFIFCLLTFILLYVVLDLFNNLNEMIESGISLIVLFPYYLNFTPFIVVQMTPIAILISTMFSLGIFSKNNEITAMRTSGISLLRILAPLIAIGLLISAAIFVINDRIVPDSTMNAAIIKDEKIEKAKREKKLRKKSEKTLENIAFYGKNNRIIYARRYNVYREKLTEVIIYDEDKNQNVVSKTSIAKAQWEKNRWRGKNIMFFRLDKNGRIIGEPEFYEDKFLDIPETPADFKKRRHQTEFMSFSELKKYIEYLSFGSGAAVRSLKVDLNHKTAFPFVNLVVILIASPFALIHARRGNIFIGIGMSIFLIAAYYVIMSISLAMGKADFLPPCAAAWSANIIFACIGTLFIVRCK